MVKNLKDIFEIPIENNEKEYQWEQMLFLMYKNDKAGINFNSVRLYEYSRQVYESIKDNQITEK
jgi:hypothetical protein